MRAAWSRVARRVGLRGVGLLIPAVGWITYGVGIAADPRYGVARGVAILTWAMPLSWWAWVWIGCGAIAMVAAVLPAGRDRAGYIAVVAPPGLWAGAYLLAWITGRYPTAWTTSPAWLVPVGLVLLVAYLTSRLVEERRLRHVLEVRCARIGAGDGH
ncbi:hypothetical protein ABZX72_29680 [Streptomyces cyaneofuscatus]|uniref:hypothetical protein n=1 Tax=Streptomyces cyaneofuscatus TaxID=66883 RepID=UPI0033AB98C5